MALCSALTPSVHMRIMRCSRHPAGSAKGLWPKRLRKIPGAARRQFMALFSGFEHIVHEQEPLARHTWLRLGGPAQYFAEPTTFDELAGLVARCRQEDVPVRLLGGGSNVLVREEGVRGLV